MFVLASAVGCGSSGDGARADAAPADASVPDAAACDLTRCGEDCVDTSMSTEHCGGCFQPCTPAQDCAGSCQCPEIAIAGEPVIAQMDEDMLAPTILGIGIYSVASDLDALVIGFADPGTPTDTDIDLSAGDPPFVAIGYQVDVQTQEFRSAYRAQTGTLRLTRRCAAGVAGTITGADLVEVDPTSEPPTVIEDGCTASITDLAFDFGDPCE